jgi:hypothetical protein
MPSTLINFILGKIGTLVVLAVLVWGVWPDASAQVPSGVLVREAPIQQETRASSFAFRGYKIKPLADFDITARVLGKEIYRFDHEAEVAPVDLALGWQSMSNSLVLDKIDISQNGRFYHWETPNFPIPRREIETQSANMHMIPSSPDIEDALKDLPENAVIRVTGHLVEVEDKNGWRWKSSMTRGDTGFGACELIWVKTLSRIR